MRIYNGGTIAAIATPIGNSGIGIVRISGNEAIRIADEIIRSRSGKSLDLFSIQSHTVHYGYVADKDNLIDEVLCTIYRRPKSFTAEDVAEISCHGGIYVLNKVLSLVLFHGARLAEPGEFTRRAFMNGRIDLSQAESVMDIISSENEFSRSNSLSQLRGSVKDRVNDFREKIIHETAFIEAALDDPEHYDIDESYKEDLRKKIDDIIKEIDIILKNSDNVKYLRNGINTVIAGKPNVGKSSLLNLFAGYERAIVTSIPGTTRDTILEKISFDDVMLNIIDTAGIHEASDVVESIGIKRAEDEIDKADLILFMLDSSIKINDEDRMIADIIRDKACIVILNKTDKEAVIYEDDVRKLIGDKTSIVKMSVKENIGMNELKNKIKDMFIKDEIRDNEIYITNKRQTELFNNCNKSLKLVRDSIDNGMSEDIYTVDLMDAYAYLGEIIGEDISDDLADRIFSEFCMGK